MFEAISNIWQAIATLFNMLNRTANALDQVARAAEESATIWANQIIEDQKVIDSTDGEEPTTKDTDHD